MIPDPAGNPGSNPAVRTGSQDASLADKSRKRLLLVEDEAIIALGEKKQLERYGYAVITATSGQKAVEICKADGDIDLILMDIDLGRGMDGTEAARLILQDRDIPIVFLSSHTEPDVVSRTEVITSYGYVVKNSSITVLDASIKMGFKLFQANQQTLALNKKLEATLDALPELLFEVDLYGRYWDAHCPEQALLYKPLDELIGSRVTDRLPAPAANIIMTAIAEANEKGLASGRQYELPMASGSRWFELTVSRMASQHETPHFILFCQDITDRITASRHRIKLEQELKESKDQAERLLEVAAEIIMCLGPDGTISLFNDNGHHVLGYEPPYLIGKNWFETCVPEELQREVAGFLAGLRSSGSEILVPHTNEVLTRAGERRTILWHNTIIKDANGAFTGILSSGQDITDRIRMEEALRESDRRFRALTDTAPVLIWECDAQGNCTYVNSYRTQFTGRSVEEEQGKGWLDTAHPDDRDACKAASEAAFASRGRFQLEYRLRKHDGTYAWILDQGTPRFTDNGEFLGYIGVCTEIRNGDLPESASSS
ncbi:MAG: PAS domain S-box protein [Clostridia bacterium]|jgi:PAS domain S-box-containing protein